MLCNAAPPVGLLFSPSKSIQPNRKNLINQATLGVRPRSFLYLAMLLSSTANFLIKYQALPRTRVSLNYKAHQLGWLKTKYSEFVKYVLIITVGYSITMEYCTGNRKKIKSGKRK